MRPSSVSFANGDSVIDATYVESDRHTITYRLSYREPDTIGDAIAKAVRITVPDALRAIGRWFHRPSRRRATD